MLDIDAQLSVPTAQVDIYIHTYIMFSVLTKY